MKVKIILVLSILCAILFCGCTTIKTKPEISDDDRYLQYLDEFSFEWQNIVSSDPVFQAYIINQTINYTSEDQKNGASLKNFANTYYNNVSGLKVSPKYENSRTSLMQSLKALDRIADYELSSDILPTESGVIRSPAETNATKDININGQIFFKSMEMIYDSNICQDSDNYPTIYFICHYPPPT